MPNSSITRTDVAALAAVFVLLGCLLFPALAQSNSNSEKSVCLNKLKQLALGMLNHHDTRKVLPLISTQPIDHKPGSAEAATGAGYSWLTQLLPYIEQPHLYDAFAKSMKAGKPAFDGEATALVGGKSLHPGTAVVSTYVCPAFKGDPHVAANESDYQTLKGDTLPALSNYHGFAGSHFFNADGLGRLNAADKLNGPYEGNGAMPFPNLFNGKLEKRGLGYQSFVDGTSNTISIAETIEPAYSAWLDGQADWLVAAWPGNEKIPAMQVSSANPMAQALAWTDEDKKTAKVAVNLRNEDGSPITYIATGRWSGSKERRYAASSNHPGSIGHAYVDGHVEMLSPDVDPNVYIQLVTRAGREIIPEEFKLKQEKNRIPVVAEGDLPRKSGPGAVQVVPNQWNSVIDWSPLAVGDLRLNFPQILSADDFRPDPINPSLLVYRGKSKVFNDIAFDKKASEILLYTNKDESPTATKHLFKQLRAALGEPTTKELEKRPKRVTWRKEAKWEDGAATFEFVLTEPHQDEPSNLIVRVIAASNADQPRK